MENADCLPGRKLVVWDLNIWQAVLIPIAGNGGSGPPYQDFEKPAGIGR